MNNAEVLAFFLLAPSLALVAGYIGRKAQRFLWELDIPYEQRTAFKSRR